MPKQMLFYELATPISQIRHGDWAVSPAPDFGFARATNSVPVTIPEFLAVSQEYPLVFSMDGDVAQPAALLGVTQDQNLFIRADGSWDGRYVPAFVRRYPFVFSASDDGETLSLCLDEAYPHIDRSGASGERLFDKDSRSPYLQRMLDFVNAYHQESQRTVDFGRMIAGLGILEPQEARVDHPGGGQSKLQGFYVVNRDKLRALPAEKLADLVRTDALELLYIHLQSLSCFDRLAARLQA